MAKSIWEDARANAEKRASYQAKYDALILKGVTAPGGKLVGDDAEILTLLENALGLVVADTVAAKFEATVRLKTDAGMQRPLAVAKIAAEQPALMREYIDSQNQRAADGQRRRQIDRALGITAGHAGQKPNA
jgi:hypothetical protein